MLRIVFLEAAGGSALGVFPLSERRKRRRQAASARRAKRPVAVPSVAAITAACCRAISRRNARRRRRPPGQALARGEEIERIVDIFAKRDFSSGRKNVAGGAYSPSRKRWMPRPRRAAGAVRRVAWSRAFRKRRPGIAGQERSDAATDPREAARRIANSPPGPACSQPTRRARPTTAQKSTSPPCT